jgi:hypothetical protein
MPMGSKPHQFHRHYTPKIKPSQFASISLAMLGSYHAIGGMSHSNAVPISCQSAALLVSNTGHIQDRRKKKCDDKTRPIQGHRQHLFLSNGKPERYH